MKRFLSLSKCFHPPNITLSKNLNLLFKPSEWKAAILEAEKLVEYSPSLLNLKCLVGEELSNVALQVKKIMGTGHPFLQTTQKLLDEDNPPKELRALVILLISKSASHLNSSSGIQQSQRTLAEITEMIHTASTIHQSVVDLNTCTPLSHHTASNEGEGADVKKKIVLRHKDFIGTAEELEHGNKVCTLSGDLLLATASTALASLNNSQVVENISTGIRDIMSGEFMRSSQHFNQTHKATSKPPSNHTLSLKNWEEFIFLTSGSLLARGCQSALELANHSKRLQQKAFDFGALMTYCHQLKDDIIALNEPDPHHQSFFAPLILYTHHLLNRLPTEKDRERELNSVFQMNNKQLNQRIRACDQVMDELWRYCGEYGAKAIETLDVFEDTPAKNILVNMVNNVITT